MAAVIILSGINLNPNLLWVDRDSWSPVEQETTRTLGGKRVTFTAGVSAGRPVTLEATIDRGWFTYTQKTMIEALAAVPGATYTLQYGDASYTVQFRHQDAPAVEFGAFVQRVEHEPGDYFTGVLKLETVA